MIGNDAAVPSDACMRSSRGVFESLPASTRPWFLDSIVSSSLLGRPDASPLVTAMNLWPCVRRGRVVSVLRTVVESRDSKRRLLRMVCVGWFVRRVGVPLPGRQPCGRLVRFRCLCAAGAGALVVVGSVGAVAPAAGHVIRVASLRVSLPAGWTWALERGGYRNCSNPIVKLWAASFRLPRRFGKHEGPLVVPPGQVLVGFVARPVRSDSLLWKRWRVSNAKLHPAVAADGSRYRAQLTFPATPAVGATAWFGSRRLSSRMLRVTNRLLASLSVDPGYGCR